jgi:hypothetical protein
VPPLRIFAAIVLAATAACAKPLPRDAERQAALANLVGVWRLSTHPAGPPGLLVDLRIDSVAGTQVFGRLVGYFSGDVGVSPGQFGPLRGTIVDSLLAVQVPWSNDTSPGITMYGVMRGDTTLVTLLVLGRDTLRSPASPRLIRRQGGTP